MNRIIKLLVALTLAASGLLVAGGATSANAASTTHQSRTVSTAAPRAAKTARSIVLVFSRATRTKFHVKAGVSPNFSNRVAILQYKRKAGGTFHKIKKDRSTAAGVVRFGKVSKLGYYRVITKEDALYIKSGSNVIRVYRA